MVSGERREAVMSKRIDCRAVAIQRTLALALLAAAMALPGPAGADDRNLVESGLQTPYVFILLDVSGSMHQTVTCSPADLASGFCNQECDLGDCLGRKSGDDLESKIAVAKQSIYNIMQTTHNVNFGFGTFDQAGLHMIYKYWYYSPDPVQPAGFITLADGKTQYPAVGQQEVFGQAFWPCTDAVGSNGQNNALRYIGCGGNVVAGNYNNVINPPTSTTRGRTTACAATRSSMTPITRPGFITSPRKATTPCRFTGSPSLPSRRVAATPRSSATPGSRSR
jgi:hypothetical protein